MRGILAKIVGVALAAFTATACQTVDINAKRIESVTALWKMFKADFETQALSRKTTINIQSAYRRY